MLRKTRLLPSLMHLSLSLFALCGLANQSQAQLSKGICGHVYIDKNCDGVVDAGDVRLNGVTVTLKKFNTATSSYATVANIPTAFDPADGDGVWQYAFGQNDSGVYQVCLNVPPGYTANAAVIKRVDGPNVPDPLPGQIVNATIISNIAFNFDTDGVLQVYDFLICENQPPQTGTIGGGVYIDQNLNGQKDPLEPPVPNVPICLTYSTPTGAITQELPTDAQGRYLFTNLPLGVSYAIKRKDIPAGYSSCAAIPAPVPGGVKVDNENINTQLTAANTISDPNDFLICIQQPGLRIRKNADKTTISLFEPVTYAYEVTNTGTTALTNVVVKDDNGTPDYAKDDFIVATIATLNAGETRNYSRTVYLPITLCGKDSTGLLRVTGTIIAEALPNGNIRATFIQHTDVNDNTYGTNTIGWGTKEHKFRDLVGSDQAQFRFLNGLGQNVLEFKLDYISASSAYPSGYGTLGVSGGDGGIIRGNRAFVLNPVTSLTENLNKQPFLGALAQYTVNSPALSDPNSSQWEYRMIYVAEISKDAFGPSGFASFAIVDQHNSPDKPPFGDFIPAPCDSCVTNIATATSAQGVAASAQAQVCITVSGGGSGGTCELGKPKILTMKYTGFNNSRNTQDPSKVIVNGNPNGATPVYIIAGTKDGKKTFFQGTVTLNGAFNIDATLAGGTRLPADTLVRIFTAQNGVLLSSVQFHTSCSQPLNLNDQFGSIQLVGYTPE